MMQNLQLIENEPRQNIHQPRKEVKKPPLIEVLHEEYFQNNDSDSELINKLSENPDDPMLDMSQDDDLSCTNNLDCLSFKTL